MAAYFQDILGPAAVTHKQSYFLNYTTSSVRIWSVDGFRTPAFQMTKTSQSSACLADIGGYYYEIVHVG
jgi:hypothetical protein